MRKFGLFSLLLLLSSMAFFGGMVHAQDPVKVGPTIYKLLFENDRIRIMEIAFKPGDKMGTHSHPDHFVYILAAGKLKITKADGKVADVDAKIGEVIWSPAETHSAVNPGTTELRALVVELKEAKK